MTENWLALIAYAKDNPYMTIERLEIYDGEPALFVIKKQISQTATAKIRIKYDNRQKIFTKKMI